MNKLYAGLAIAAAVLAFSAAVYFKGVFDGKDTVRQEQTDAMIANALTQITIRKAARKRQESLRIKQLAERKRDNAKIQELLRTNKQLNLWWNAPVHRCAVSYIFRLQLDDCSQMPSGQGKRAETGEP